MEYILARNILVFSVKKEIRQKHTE